MLACMNSNGYPVFLLRIVNNTEKPCFGIIKDILVNPQGFRVQVCIVDLRLYSSNVSCCVLDQISRRINMLLKGLKYEWRNISSENSPVASNKFRILCFTIYLFHNLVRLK